jgi:hypothetical protein
MKSMASPGEIDRLQRMHQVRRVVTWVIVVLLGLALTSVAFATPPTATTCMGSLSID